jgi:hypothetical protein
VYFIPLTGHNRLERLSTEKVSLQKVPMSSIASTARSFGDKSN